MMTHPWSSKLRRRRGRAKLILALVVAALLVWVWSAPKAAQETAKEAAEGDWLQGLVGGLGFENFTANETTKEVQIKYQSGTLENLGVVQANAQAGAFDAAGTAPSGSPARFELICGAKVCDSAQDVYQEPLTYWIVTVPPTAGVSKLVITAGAAYLEVEI